MAVRERRVQVVSSSMAVANVSTSACTRQRSYQIRMIESFITFHLF